MIIDKESRTRVTSPKRGVDIVVDAEGPAVLSQEVITVIGGFKDFTGSGGIPTKQAMMFPTANKLWGTDAWVENAKVPAFDEIGNIKTITRLRRLRKTLQL